MAGIIGIYRKGLFRKRLQCTGQNRFIQAHDNGIQHAISVVGQRHMVAGFVTAEIEDIVIFDFFIRFVDAGGRDRNGIDLGAFTVSVVMSFRVYIKGNLTAGFFRFDGNKERIGGRNRSRHLILYFEGVGGLFRKIRGRKVLSILQDKSRRQRIVVLVQVNAVLLVDQRVEAGILCVGAGKQVADIQKRCGKRRLTVKAVKYFAFAHAHAVIPVLNRRVGGGRKQRRCRIACQRTVVFGDAAELFIAVKTGILFFIA